MEKNRIKEYFRNGSRPTQENFYDLIDACFNEDSIINLSGYELLTDIADRESLKSLQRRAGRTALIPWFKRINTQHKRTYNYSIPCSNLGPHMVLDTIGMELQLPPNKVYEVKDKTSPVKITQTISLESVAFYNGTESLLVFEEVKIPKETYKEFLIRKSIDKWKGISIDITVRYDIKSNIAISDQFDITNEHAKELEHVFGGVVCKFRKVAS